jgi:hypothetical protein
MGYDTDRRLGKIQDHTALNGWDRRWFIDGVYKQ